MEVDRRAGEVRLAAIYIRPERQGRGLGTAVIEELIGESREHAIPLTLEVLKVNPRARALYERLGFVVTGETETHHHMAFTS